MARIRYDELNRLEREVSIVKLCRRRGIRLKRTDDPNQLSGRCPYCRKPVFVARVKENLFYCTQCRAGGYALDLVAKLDGCDVRRATETLLAAGPEIQRTPVRKGASHHAANP